MLVFLYHSSGLPLLCGGCCLIKSDNGVRPVLQRLADGRRKERFRIYLQNLLSSGLPVLPYDSAAALWHGEQRARLEARGLRPAFADGQIAAIAATQGLVLVTRNISDFAAFDGLQLLNWFPSP